MHLSTTDIVQLGHAHGSSFILGYPGYSSVQSFIELQRTAQFHPFLDMFLRTLVRALVITHIIHYNAFYKGLGSDPEIAMGPECGSQTGDWCVQV